MKRSGARFAALLLVLSVLLTACRQSAGAEKEEKGKNLPSRTQLDTEHFLTFADDNADTVDPQCTTAYYTIALNVFDRLLEVQVNEDGRSELVPSLAESWEISEDGLIYRFHLRRGVTFSNGSPLTASDVLYTFKRLLTWPNSVNQDIALPILGADKLREGARATLSGFRTEGDYDFSITLAEPYSAFLACLSAPGASILDEETTTRAGALFGRDARSTVGTGPFVFYKWTPGMEMILTANENCWSGPPRCEGLNIRIIKDKEAQRLLFESGKLDIIDLDNMGSEAEYFIHGDIYQDHLVSGPRVGITYIALNQSIEPLNDLRVRRAMQMALDRNALLIASYGGRGIVENGIFPHGLIGFSPSLPQLTYDPVSARALLAEAGYEDGLTLELNAPSNAPQSTLELLALIASMWEKVGVSAKITVLEESRFMQLRKAGALVCYCSTWSADFNDPDNFIYPFFGNVENTTSRSLCYPDEEVMARVNLARGIVDTEERLREYLWLERKIVQEDAAWIPLFSRQHYFVVNPRVKGFRVSWNGWSSTNYRDVEITE